MARAPAAPAATPEPVVPAETRHRICMTCKHWKPYGNDPVLGECMPSLRARMAPLVTTDLTTCTRHVFVD